MFSFIINIGFFILLGITSYYTVLYTQLNESINNLSEKIDTKCGVVENYKSKNSKTHKKKSTN